MTTDGPTYSWELGKIRPPSQLPREGCWWSSPSKAPKLVVYYSFLEGLCTLSHCKRKQCAALITEPSLHDIYAIGYNGPPAGVNNDACSGEKPCGCVHAEQNALLKLRAKISNGVLLCTSSPCLYCAASILNSRSITLVAFTTFRMHDLRPLQMLHNGGVATLWLKKE